jgi:hypothetical protein
MLEEDDGEPEEGEEELEQRRLILQCLGQRETIGLE